MQFDLWAPLFCHIHCLNNCFCSPHFIVIRKTKTVRKYRNNRTQIVWYAYYGVTRTSHKKPEQSTENLVCRLEWENHFAIHLVDFLCHSLCGLIVLHFVATLSFVCNYYYFPFMSLGALRVNVTSDVAPMQMNGTLYASKLRYQSSYVKRVVHRQ